MLLLLEASITPDNICSRIKGQSLPWLTGPLLASTLARNGGGSGYARPGSAMVRATAALYTSDSA